MNLAGFIHAFMIAGLVPVGFLSCLCGLCSGSLLLAFGSAFGDCETSKVKKGAWDIWYLVVVSGIINLIYRR